MHLFKMMQSSFSMYDMPWGHLQGPNRERPSLHQLFLPNRQNEVLLEVGCKRLCCLLQESSFGEVNTGYLDVPTCHKTCPVHTNLLNFKDQLIFDAHVIRGLETFTQHLPYLLLVHTNELFVNGFLPFLQESLLR